MSLSINIQELKAAGFAIIDIDVYRDLKVKLRSDIQQKICSTKEAMFILNISKNEFYKLLDSPDCLIKPSKRRGQFDLASVNAEADRQNN